MNYGIVRVEKIKLADGGGLRGRAMHDFRQFKSGQNEKTYMNQYTGCTSYAELRKKAEAMWATLDGKPRSDAVGLLEVMVTTTAGGIPDGKEADFFADVRREVEGWYGPNSVLSMAIHRDETTPHCHLFVMPISRKEVKKNRLNKEEKARIEAGGKWPSQVKTRLDTKKLLDGRESLSALQTAFHSHVFKKYGLERGEIHVEEEKKKHNVRSSLKLKEEALAKKELELTKKEEQVDRERQDIKVEVAKQVTVENTRLQQQWKEQTDRTNAYYHKKYDDASAQLHKNYDDAMAKWSSYVPSDLAHYDRVMNFCTSTSHGNWETELENRKLTKGLIDKLLKIIYALKQQQLHNSRKSVSREMSGQER